MPDAVASATYNAANQQLTFGDYAIQYDGNGNMTNIVTSTMTNRLYWSSRNLLTNMASSVSASFVYDGIGRRITRTVSGATQKYLYDGLDIVLQKDGSDAIVASYLRGLAIDEPWQRTENSTNEVYLADALGSVVALADDDGSTTTEYDYEPFGETTEAGNASSNPYKFTAREDDGTGLYHYRARYYHPALGRFISEDPIEYAGGVILRVKITHLFAGSKSPTPEDGSFIACSVSATSFRFPSCAGRLVPAVCACQPGG